MFASLGGYVYFAFWACFRETLNGKLGTSRDEQPCENKKQSEGMIKGFFKPAYKGRLCLVLE